jgi:preprotein translocase subunit SecA
MNMEERRQALLDKDPAGYGIYEGEVRFFLQQLEDMEQVKRLGGLHVIGSERHEARRIDNQLRGRSARQGDPGSSRFYLSMEDELMRRFGGQQANDLMQRLKIDDSLPLEMGIVSRLVEQSQTRVEGANFDVRKHLLEYDDVLNAQRKRIYEQRDRIFTKDDLSEDVTEMLRTEVKRRVPQALKDEEGPWRLLAWLDGIQPPLAVEGAIFPSFTYRLLLEHLSTDAQAQVNPQAALLTIAEGALRAEEEHLLHSLQTLIATTRERMESQLRERLEALDTFIEGLNLEENEDREGENTRSGRSSRELADEISSLLRVPVRLSPEQQRALKNPADQEALESIAEDLRAQVETAVATQAFLRLIGAMERRMDESLELPAVQFTVEEWDEKVDQILEAVQNSLEKRRQRLIGAGTDGQLAKELDNILQRKEKTLQPEEWLNLLLRMTQGARTMYDKRTHRRLLMHTTRLSYTHFAARYIDNLAPEDIAESVLEHLEQAQAAIRRHWGAAEWERLAATRPAELDESIQAGLRTVLGEERYTQTQLQPLQTLDMEEIQVVKDELGRQALTEVYRPLLLSVITDLWVEFLTQMEALRVSIGLEAYAQRDPLVQYKTRASALFQDLFSNMRLGVINRMFTFRPRPAAGAQQGARRGKESGEAEIGAGLESPLTEDLIIDYNGDEAAEDAVSGKDEAPSSESNPEIAGEETGIASVKPLALKPKHNGTPDRAKGKEARLSGAPDGAKEDDARLSKSQKRRRGRR